MVKDHSDSERGNPLPPHGLLFPISSKGSFICIIPQITAFVNPVVEDWLEREIAQWVHPMNDRSDDPSHHERSYTELHLAPALGLQALEHSQNTIHSSVVYEQNHLGITTYKYIHFMVSCYGETLNVWYTIP